MVSWRSNPNLKVEAGSTEISQDSVGVEVHRPENAVSWVKLLANDKDGKNFIGELDVFTVLKVSFRYGSDSWTKVFEGKIREPTSALSMEGQLTQAKAYGYGMALRDTHCDAEYGSQVSSSLDEPDEIWDDLVDNHINKAFGGAATGYTITKTKMLACGTPIITYLNGGYRSNIEVGNEVCKLRCAEQAGSAGVHWFVDPSKNWFIDTIGNHSVAGWSTWWDTDQAGSTLTQGVDFVNYDFVKRGVYYANKVLVASAFRKPGYDYWTEGQAGSWGNDGITNINNNAVTYVVGSQSIEFDMDSPPGSGRAYWPSTEDAAWDLTKIGSENTIPTVNFYFYKDNNCNEPSCELRLCSTDHDNDYFYVVFSTWTSDPNNEWVHRSIPIGPYWKSAEESRRYRWVGSGGTENWNSINCLAFRITANPATDTEFLIDDLHIAGKIVREAYSSADIGAPGNKDEHQKILRLDTAVDDTLKASDDSGTAGLLAYHELLVRMTNPVVGKVVLPLIVTPEILPGQLIHPHANEQASGAFRVDDDFRVKEIVHNFTVGGAFTTLDVTDDVTNTFALGYTNMLEILAKVQKVDPEAQNLKASGIDVKIARLNKDY